MANYLYYPFGIHKDIESIANQVDGANVSKVFLKNFDANDSTEVNTIKALKSEIKLFYDEEQSRYQIVSATIYDANFHINSNIKIGMSKQKFLNIFFSKPPVIPVNIVKFISAVDGIKHYYYFKNDKLIEIKMVTDYMFEGK